MGEGAPTRDDLEAAGGRGVRLLVMDSGVDLAHPAFAGRDMPCWCIEECGPGFEVVEAEGGDAVGHGTAVAGIILRHAPEVTLESLRVLDADKGSSSERVLFALRWAVNEGYDVLNCSFGSKGTRYVAPYKSIVDLAFRKNVLLIGACSNEAHQPTSYPACFPTAISADRGRLHPAEYPALPHIERRRDNLIEFVLHGINVRAPWLAGGMRQVSGSSFAAPHLAALVARIRQVRPTWNACQVKALLYELAEDHAESAER